MQKKVWIFPFTYYYMPSLVDICILQVLLFLLIILNFPVCFDYNSSNINMVISEMFDSLFRSHRKCKSYGNLIDTVSFFTEYLCPSFFIYLITRSMSSYRFVSLFFQVNKFFWSQGPRLRIFVNRAPGFVDLSLCGRVFIKFGSVPPIGVGYTSVHDNMWNIYCHLYQI